MRVSWGNRTVMQENKEKWMELCEQAAIEQDREKFMALMAQIDALLQAKEERLRVLRTGRQQGTTD
jgi:hypothetical protein